MTSIEDQLSKAFVCTRCAGGGASVRTVAIPAEKTSRFLPQQSYRFALASCRNCGTTEVFDAETLEGKPDLGAFLWFLFAAEKLDEPGQDAIGVRGS